MEKPGPDKGALAQLQVVDLHQGQSAVQIQLCEVKKGHLEAEFKEISVTFL